MGLRLQKQESQPLVFLEMHCTRNLKPRQAYLALQIWHRNHKQTVLLNNKLRLNKAYSVINQRMRNNSRQACLEPKQLSSLSQAFLEHSHKPNR